MTHVPEFQPPAPVAAVKDQAARDLAACYARVFLGDTDGKRVLADLRAKFGLERLVFKISPGSPYDPLAAALTDGERRVMSEIEQALLAGAPLQILPPTQPNKPA